ncbi:MAG TPA: glycosyltransferase family 1 protein [Gemmataceae bacterium]|nr:glycosyltransferase family 1 protein [Gemmataceae bacterium]
MRIALNMLFVAPGVAGGRVYCEGLLKGLQEVDRENEYVAYTRRGIRLPPLDPARFRQVEAPVAPASTVWRTLWEYRRLPRLLRREGFDLFHGLGTLSPSSRSCPFVLTIHDLIYRHFPASLPLGYRLFMRWVHPTVARRADRVIVPSRCTARDVVELLGVKEERIRVVPYGPGNDFRPVTDQARIEAALARYGVRRPYVISVCRAYVHKNLAGLLRAYAVLRSRDRRDVQLVLVGEKYRTGDALARLAEELGVQEAVVFTGFASHEDLNALYCGAAVFAFPSLAEGYGLPVLEAMACGTPVVASNASAVPEAVGAAGVVADARNPEAFAAALARMLEDDDLRAQSAKRGLARAAEFSWETTAAGTLGVYRELA